MQLADSIHLCIYLHVGELTCGYLAQGLLPSVLAIGMQLRQAIGMRQRQAGSMRLGEVSIILAETGEWHAAGGGKYCMAATGEWHAAKSADCNKGRQGACSWGWQMATGGDKPVAYGRGRLVACSWGWQVATR